MVFAFNPQGIKEPECVKRRTRSLFRGTSLPDIGNYDFRDLNPVSKDRYPTLGTTESYQVSGLDLSTKCDGRLRREKDSRELRQSLENTARHNRLAHTAYGDEYWREGYFNPEVAALTAEEERKNKEQAVLEALDRVPLLAPGTYASEAYAFREEAEVSRWHNGKYGFCSATGEMMWSCCGREAADAPGCQGRVRHPHRPNYRLGPFEN